MTLLGWKSAHKFFKLICICVTLGLIIWCSYEFHKNEDICEVIFKKFLDDDDSDYPVLTFIVPNRFNETLLKRYGKGITPEAYRHFLVGHFWSEKLPELNYSEVSMKLEDYLIESCVYTSIQSRYYGYCRNDTRIETQDFYGSKSFMLHVPKNKPMYSVAVKLRKSIFKDNVRPASGQFMIMVSHPNKMFSALSSSLDTWPARNNQSSKIFNMRFLLKGMEVLQRRQKKHKPCYESGNFDELIMSEIIETAGCRPSYWSINSLQPICKSQTSFQAILNAHLDQVSRNNKTKQYITPCSDIEKLQIEYVEEDVHQESDAISNKDNDDWFMIEFIIQINKFKEIRQIRKYSVQSLVGNLGGYIGLCLGYALLNLPSVILEIWNHLRSFFRSYKKERVYVKKKHETIWAEMENFKNDKDKCLKYQDAVTDEDKIFINTCSLTDLVMKINSMQSQLDILNMRLNKDL